MSHIAMLMCQIWILLSLLVTVDGQCSGSALQLTATSQPQYMTSPNYPSDYTHNLTCQWELIGSASSGVIINIEDLEIEADASCQYDSLSIYHGSSSGGTLLTKSCTGVDDVHAAVSTATNFYIEFITDHSTVRRGFNILYFVADAAYQPACDSNIAANYSETYLMTPTLPAIYDSGQTCTYDFTAPSGFTINITYYFIDIENDASCANNKLAVYDGAANSATLLASHCSQGDIYNFTSSLTTGDTAHVEFVTGTNSQFLGFMFSYRAYLTTTTTTNCSTTAINLEATTHHNYITTIDYGNSNYARNLDCFWLLTAPTNEAVEVQFLVFSGETYSLEYNYYCSYDYILLYDGNSTSDSLIHAFCGSLMVSQTIRSSAREMLVFFTSDYALQKSGFRLAYKAVDNTYPGCKASYTNILDTLYNVDTSYIASGYTYKNSTTSTNYPSTYPRYSDEFWLLTNANPTNYSIIVEITDISIERTRACKYDKLVIYNGPCIKDGPLETLCGFRETMYELNGSEFLVHFHSDGSNQRRGFSFDYYANYTNVTLPTTTTTTTNGPPVEAVVDAMNTALENYTTDNLPNKDLTDAIQAKFDFYLVGINGLDEVDQTFTSTGQFEVTWNDSSLSWLPDKQQGVVRMLFPQDDVWKPDIVLLNGVTKITPMGASFMFVDVDSNGVCVWKPYQILETTCKVDMTFYPYDKQTCVLKFSTWSSSGSEVSTSLGEQGFQIHTTFQKNSVWDLVSTETVQDVENGQNVVKFTLNIRRKPAYVTFYITIPLVMLAYLNVFTFAIPCGSGEKSGFSITVFLSFIVVLIVITDAMPDNSDSISLYGAYIFTMTLLSALTVMISVAQLRALSFNEEDRPIAKRVKKWILAIQSRKWKLFTRITPVKTIEQPSTSTKKDDEEDYDDDNSSLGDVEDNKGSSSSSGFEDMDQETSPKRVSFRDDNLLSEESDLYGLRKENLRVQRDLTIASIMLDREDTVIAGASAPKGTNMTDVLGEVTRDSMVSPSEDSEIKEDNHDGHVGKENNSKKVKFASNDDNSQGQHPNLTPDVSEDASTVTSQPPPYESLNHDQTVTNQSGRSVARSGILKGILAERPRSVIDNRQISLHSRKGSMIEQRPFSKLSFGESGPVSSSGVFTPQRSETLSDEDSLIGSYSDSESDDLSGVMSHDDDDDNPSWPELVNASDIILFVVYLLVTSLLTMSFFLPMALN